MAGKKADDLSWMDEYQPGEVQKGAKKESVPGYTGNIDLFNRPKIKNKDGSVSTVYSMTVGPDKDGKYTLIPGVRHGLDRQMTEEEAVEWSRKTGEHLGRFNSIKDADTFAENLHKQQERLYAGSASSAKASRQKKADDDLSWMDEYQPKPVEFSGLPGGYAGPPVADEIPLPPGVPVSRLSGYDAKTGAWSVAPEKPMQTEFTDVPGKKLTAKEVGNIKTIDPGKPLRAAAAGALDAATLGFGDEAAAALSSIGKPVGTYQKERDLNRRIIKESQAEDPAMALAGGLFGGMSLAPLSMASAPANLIAQGGNVAKTAKTVANLRMLAEGTTIGAAAGLGSSEAELAGQHKQIGQSLVDTAKGAGFGLGGTAAVLGGQKVANAIRTAPERVAAKDDQLLVDALMHRFPKAQRDEMIGHLGENREYLLRVVKEDSELVQALRSGEKVDAGKILSAKAEAEKQALESTLGGISAEKGPIPAQTAIGDLESRADVLGGSLKPSAAKTAKELAGVAAKIREDVMPVEGMGLVEKVAGKSSLEAKRRMAESPKEFRADLSELGVSGVIDDSVAVMDKIRAGRAAVDAHLADKTKEVAARLGDLDAAMVADEFGKSNVSTLAKRAQQIKDETLPLTQRQARAKVLSRAGAEEQRRIINKLEDYQGELDKLGVQKFADDPVATYDAVSGARGKVGEAVGEFKDKIDPVQLQKFSAEYMAAAQELDRNATVASGLRHVDAANEYIANLWRRYSPENVTESGAIVPVAGRKGKDITLPFESARKELTDLQAKAYGGPMMDPSPKDKANRNIAGAVLDFMEGHAAGSLSKKDAKRYIDLNKRYSRLITLEDATEPARRAAILSAEPPMVLPRTGKISASELLSMRANASTEERAAIDRILAPKLAGLEKAGEPAAGAYLSARAKSERLATLEDAMIPSYISARTSANAPKVKPRTGQLDVRDVIAARNEMTDEGAKATLASIIDKHIGPGNSAKLAAQEKRAQAVGQMAKSLDYQARDAASMINPGLRGIQKESVDKVSNAGANAGILGSIMTGNPAVMAAAAAIKLGVSGAPAQAAEKLDRGIALMVKSARKGASVPAIAKVGKVIGLGAELAEDAALTISQRIAPLKVGKRENDTRR